MSLVSRELAQEAVGYARPLFEFAVSGTAFGESGAAHVVIVRPVPYSEALAFEEAILYEESFNRERWDADYAGYARAKARLAWRVGRDTHAVQMLAPHLLDYGDTLLGGGIYADGIAIGVSGMHAWFDEALATSVAGLLRALARREVASREGKATLERGA